MQVWQVMGGDLEKVEILNSVKSSMCVATGLHRMLKACTFK